MGDLLRKVRTGERLRIQASTWNVLMDVAQSHKNGQMNGGPPEVGVNSRTLVIRNSSGSDVPRFGVLGVDSFIIDPDDNVDEFLNRPAIDGVTPDAEEHFGRFAILLAPAPTQGIARCVVSGLVPVQVDVTDVSHRFADIADGEVSHLASAASGAAQLITLPEETGLQWLYVRLGPPPEAFVDCIVGGATPSVVIANQQWSYELIEAAPDGSGGWRALEGGRTFSGAFNRNECISPDVFENIDCEGVTPPEGHTLAEGLLIRRPVPAGRPVRAHIISTPSGGEVWFDAPNPACPFCETGESGEEGGGDEE